MLLFIPKISHLDSSVHKTFLSGVQFWCTIAKFS
uniref:Uncharacterized protein n=1 Tax=Anguilla anguilla TaxID=7936 RepID=A0A0E9RLV5_ANGAN